MLTTADIGAEDMHLVRVFEGAFGKSGMWGTQEAVRRLNDPEAISLGECGGKIVVIDSLEDTKAIQGWIDLCSPKFIKYVTGDLATFERLDSGELRHRTKACDLPDLIKQQISVRSLVQSNNSVLWYHLSEAELVGKYSAASLMRWRTG